MWFMNHIWNPIVRFILRSPLHGIMSKNLMLITYTGQKSGKEFTLPVSYLQDGDTVFVIPGMPEKKVWWHNIHQNTPVLLRLRGKVISSQASLLSVENDLETMARALSLFKRKLPAGASSYKVKQDSNGEFDRDDLKRAARDLVIIRFKPVA
jgi:deazaflavin-dependent oxidoreductase (nitroreductase family)